MSLKSDACPGCGQPVDARAPACPHCGAKIYVEHPGDIKGVKHPPLPPFPGEPKPIAPAAEEETFAGEEGEDAADDPQQGD